MFAAFIIGIQGVHVGRHVAGVSFGRSCVPVGGSCCFGSLAYLLAKASAKKEFDSFMEDLLGRWRALHSAVLGLLAEQGHSPP